MTFFFQDKTINQHARWQKSETWTVMNHYLCRKSLFVHLELIFFHPLLELIDVLVIIFPLKRWYRKKGKLVIVLLSTLNTLQYNAFSCTIYLFGEPSMPGVTCRHWGVFVSGKIFDFGVTGSRSDIITSWFSLRHRDGTCPSRTDTVSHSSFLVSYSLEGDSLVLTGRHQPQSVYSACTQSWKCHQHLLWAWRPGTDAPAPSSLRFPPGQISQEDL